MISRVIAVPPDHSTGASARRAGGDSAAHRRQRTATTITASTIPTAVWASANLTATAGSDATISAWTTVTST